MAKVFMLCGKICSGKSTYAEKLRKECKAVILSIDEITLALFGQNAGEKLDEYVAKAEEYLYNKSLEIIETGINVILDWGLWTASERDYARKFYRSKGIEAELHYIDIDKKEWEKRISKRNNNILDEKINAYYVDEGLKLKFESIFEEPKESELDVRVLEKYEFDYWFEWGCDENWCPCLWAKNSKAEEKYDYCVDIFSLPISKDLIDFLCQLGIQHDKALDWDSPPDPLLWTDEEKQDFYKKAKEGYERLKAELGDNYLINYCEDE